MTASLRLLATLLLLSSAASVAEAARPGACPQEAATLQAPTEHSHAVPGESGHGPPPPVPAHDCPLPIAGHSGCAVASLPAPAASGEFLPSLRTRVPVAPDQAHAVLLARDPFHPPRR